MADIYKVGNGPGKDRYMVGQKGKDVYAVGQMSSKGGSKQGGGSNGLASSDVDPVVGSKSQFNYKGIDPADVGDKADNMNFGGAVQNGIQKDNATGAGGEIPLAYSEKGDWDVQKDAMARRKRMIEMQRTVNGKVDFDTPTVSIIDVKK